MDKIKISSLGTLDEQKFKKLADDRQDWLHSGTDMIINPNFKVNKLAQEIKGTNNLVMVNKIIDEGNEYKTILFSNIKGNSLPLFKAGQKVAITVKVDEKYYTRPYTITCSPSRALDGEITITVKNDTEDMVANFLYNSAKIGEKVIVSEPFGDFYYDFLRDTKNIVAIVSEDGIFPIYSMVQAVVDRSEKYNLTIFYSAKSEKDLLFKDELLEYADKLDNIKINFVLSEEEKEGYMVGFVSLNRIKEVYEEGNTTFFISGGEGLLKYLNKELEPLKLPKKFVRYESFLPKCGIKRVVKYNLTIYVNDEKFEIPCYNNKTIMEAIVYGGIYIPSKCQNGSCGFCRSELVCGEVKIVNDKRTKADKKYNYIHPCTTYPLSDLEIIVR